MFDIRDDRYFGHFPMPPHAGNLPDKTKIMKRTDTIDTQQLTVNQYVQSDRIGIQMRNLTRHTIGFIVSGAKRIYRDDRYGEISRGMLYSIPPGIHYIENIPDNDDRPFEEIVFLYTQPMLAQAMQILSLNYNLSLSAPNPRPAPPENRCAFEAWKSIRSFFAGIAQYLRDDVFLNAPSVEKLRFTELIYLCMSHGDTRLRDRILSNTDFAAETLEQTVTRYLFEDLTIEQLASRCNRSATSLKNEFRRRFNEPPHRWILRRRLTHSRFLLVSTDKTVSQICAECCFSNTSHFIKLFRNEYGETPAVYRNRILREKMQRPTDAPERADNVRTESNVPAGITGYSNGGRRFGESSASGRMSSCIPDEVREPALTAPAPRE